MELTSQNAAHDPVPLRNGRSGDGRGRRVVPGRALSILAIVTIALAVCLWGGFLLSRSIVVRQVRALVEQELARDLGVKISVGQVDMESPGSIAISEVQVRGASGVSSARGHILATVERVILTINPIGLFAQRHNAVGALKSLQFIRPRVFVTRGATDGWEFGKVFSGGTEGLDLPQGLRLTAFVQDAELMIRDRDGRDTGSGVTGVSGSVSFSDLPQVKVSLGGRTRGPGGGFSVEGWVNAGTGMRVSRRTHDGVALAAGTKSGGAGDAGVSTYRAKFKINKGTLNLPGTKPDGKPGNAPVLGGLKVEKLTGLVNGEVEVSGKLGEWLSFTGKLYLKDGDLQLARVGSPDGGLGNMDKALSALESAGGKVEGEIQFAGRAPQKAIDALASSATGEVDLERILDALNMPGVSYTYEGNARVSSGKASIGKLMDVCEKLEGTFDGDLSFSKPEGGAPQYEGQVNVKNGEIRAGAIGSGVKSLAGGISGNISFDGSGNSFKYGGQVKIYNGSVELASLGSGSQISGVAGDLNFTGEDGRLDYSGKLTMPGSPVKIDKLLPGLEGIEGEIDGEIDIKGSFGGKEPLVQGKAAFRSLPLGEWSLGNVSFGFFYSSGMVSIQDFKAQALGGTVSLIGLAGPDDMLGDLKFSGIRTSELGKLGRILSKGAFGEPGGLLGNGGSLDGRVFLKSSRTGVEAVSTIGIKSFEFMSYPIDEASCNLQFSDGNFLITDLSIQGLGARVTGLGKISPGGKLDLDLTAQDIPLARILGSIAPAPVGKPPLTGLLRFVGGLGGTIKEPVLSGFVDIRNGVLGIGSLSTKGRDFRLLRSKITLSGDHIDFDGLELYSGNGTYVASGSVNFRARPLYIDMQVSSKGASLDDIIALTGVGLDVQGNADINVRLKGGLDSLWARGGLSLSRGQAFGVPIGPGLISFSAQSGDIKLESVSLAAAGGRVLAAGMIFPARGALDIDVNAAGISLESVRLDSRNLRFKRLGGRFDFDGRISGNMRHPEVEGKIGGQGIVLNSAAFGRADGHMRWKDGMLSFDELNLNEVGDGQGALSAKGDIEFSGEERVAVGVKAVSCRLSTLAGLAGLAEAGKFGGVVLGDITVGGRLISPLISAKAVISSFAVNGIALGEVQIDAENLGSDVTIRKAVLSAAKGNISMSGGIGGQGTLSLVAHARDFDLAPLGRALGGSYAMRGLLNVDARLDGTLAAPRGRFEAMVLGGGVERFRFDKLSGTFSLEPGKIAIDEMKLTQGTYVLSLHGDVPLPFKYLSALGIGESNVPSGKWDLWVKAAKTDLAFLGSFGKLIDWAEGKADMALHIVGDKDSPKAFGDITVDGASLKLASFADAVTGIRGRIAFEGDRARVEELVGGIRDGSVRVTGTVGVADFWDPALALGIEVDQLPILTDKMTGRLDGKVMVTGPVSFPKVTGKVRLDRAEVPFVSVGALSGAGYNVGLDLVVDAGDDVRVKGSGLDVEVLGQLGIGGTLREPAIVGGLDARRGQFLYLGTKFDVIRGHAEFSAERGIVPEVSLTCETFVKDVKVMLNMTGLLGGGSGALSIALSSSPPMSQDQILTLLNYPAALSKLLAGNVEGALENEVSRLIDQELRNRLSIGLERLFKEALAIDEFRVERGQQEELTVRLGKYLLKNFYLSYSRALGYDPKDVVRLDYYCSPTTILSGRIDAGKDYQAGIEVRFGF